MTKCDKMWQSVTKCNKSATKCNKSATQQSVTKSSFVLRLLGAIFLSNGWYYIAQAKLRITIQGVCAHSVLFGASFLCFVKIAWVKFCNTKFKLKINIKFFVCRNFKMCFFLIDEEYYLKIPFKYGYLCYLKKKLIISIRFFCFCRLISRYGKNKQTIKVCFKFVFKGYFLRCNFEC